LEKGQCRINNNETIGRYPRAVRLGIPMKLNNLAGGVAGGAAGVHANTTFIIGIILYDEDCQCVGLYLNASVNEMKRIDTRIISGSIFACLAVTQLMQLL